MKIIAIAGGSGTGKSSVSYYLEDTYPELFAVLNFDDYQQQKVNPGTPRLQGMVNWDHPDIIEWDKLIDDLEKLQSGKDIEVMSWSHRSNPNYDKHKQMLKRTIQPPQILILEGYMVLHDKRVINLCDLTFYLDLSLKYRNERRDKVGVSDNEYIEKILKPMHDKYIEPTKNSADYVIKVENKSINDIADYIYGKIK